MKTISERLRHAMFHADDMSQSALAEAAGVSQPTIWKLLNGKTQKSRELPNISAALGVNVEWLVNGRGEMTGGGQLAVPRIDLSKQIAVWDIDGETEDTVTSPGDKPKKTWRAYVMNRNSGVAEAPAGSIVVIDTDIEPGTRDLVVAKVSGRISTFRYITGTDGSGYLSVDDNRVPMSPVSPDELIGVAIFLVRDLRR